MKFRDKEIYDFIKCPNYGDWTFNGKTKFLILNDLQKILNNKKIVNIELKDIAWRGKNLKLNYRRENCICCGGERYSKVDISFPLLLIEGLSNIMNLKYINIDGKHRAEKLLSLNHNTAQCCVVTCEEVTPFLLTYIQFIGRINSV